MKLHFQCNKEKRIIEDVEEYRGKHILVVDDDLNSLQWLEEIFNEFQMHVVCKASGRDAVNYAYDVVKKAEKIDYILLTWKMQGMDGVETTKLLRKILGFNVPILMQTSYEWSEIEFRARDVGVNFFTIKPITLSGMIPLMDKMNARMEQMEEGETIPSFQGKRVLLVEPDQTYRGIIEECLLDVDITVDVVLDGKQAVEKIIITDENYYDMILMETEMKEINGMETTKIIRKMQRDYTKKIPIIALGDETTNKDMIQIAKCGMNGHIKKPIELRDLYETLRAYLLLQ